MDLRGKNVILTGGSRGLGAVIAGALAERGARLALSARTADDLESVRADLERSGAKVVAVVADVTDEDDRERLVSTAEAELGPTDVLVNNAGMQTILGLADQSEDDVRRQIDLNVTSLLLLTRRVVPGMLERRSGHIVNMGSVVGMAIVPFEAVYSATKHAVKGFTYGLWAELRGTGVDVSLVAPGLVRAKGMFASELAAEPPRWTGSASSPERVAAAVVTAIEKERPEVTAMGPLGRVSDLALAVSPRLLQAIYLRNPAHRLVTRIAAANAAANAADRRDGAGAGGGR